MQARGIGEGRSAGHLAAVACEIESELHGDSIRRDHHTAVRTTRNSCMCPGPGSAFATGRWTAVLRHDLIHTARGTVVAGYGASETNTLNIRFGEGAMGE